MPNMKKPAPDAPPAVWLAYAAYRAKCRAAERARYHKNPYKYLERKRSESKRNPNMRASVAKRYRTRHRKDIRNKDALRRTYLGDAYVLDSLGIRAKCVPAELVSAVKLLVDLKREQLKLCRLIRQKKKEETT